MVGGFECGLWINITEVWATKPFCLEQPSDNGVTVYCLYCCWCCSIPAYTAANVVVYCLYCCWCSVSKQWNAENSAVCIPTVPGAGCPDNMFGCDAVRCIPTAWLCDGAGDCSDREDEKICTVYNWRICYSFICEKQNDRSNRVDTNVKFKSDLFLRMKRSHLRATVACNNCQYHTTVYTPNAVVELLPHRVLCLYESGQSQTLY